MPLSNVAASSAIDFCIAPHCARGICQLATYEYIAGFCLVAAICATEGATHTAEIASTHTPIAILHTFLFTLCLLEVSFPRSTAGRKKRATRRTRLEVQRHISHEKAQPSRKSVAL